VIDSTVIWKIQTFIYQFKWISERLPFDATLFCEFDSKSECTNNLFCKEYIPNPAQNTVDYNFIIYFRKWHWQYNLAFGDTNCYILAFYNISILSFIIIHIFLVIVLMRMKFSSLMNLWLFTMKEIEVLIYLFDTFQMTVLCYNILYFARTSKNSRIITFSKDNWVIRHALNLNRSGECTEKIMRRLSFSIS
jgi:hypothetical protein